MCTVGLPRDLQIRCRCGVHAMGSRPLVPDDTPQYVFLLRAAEMIGDALVPGWRVGVFAPGRLTTPSPAAERQVSLADLARGVTAPARVTDNSLLALSRRLAQNDGPPQHLMRIIVQACASGVLRTGAR